MRIRAHLAAATALLLAAPAAAQQAPTDAAWHVLAEADSSAALALIAENHPGASPELGDIDFQAKLATARAHVAERLPRVTSFAAYHALMNGLATDFRDGHIWSRALAAPAALDWTGLILTRQGGQWIVGAQEAASGEPELKGARLTACDGVPAERFAAERLGLFYANPAVEAELARRAPVLLFDDGNPFLTRPRRCDFTTAAGGSVALELHWRLATQSRLDRLAADTLHPAKAGMGVEPFAGGYWISLGTLGDSAQAVVDAVKAQQAALRAAPMVVIDLRGNGGGDSRYADRIAAALVGEARMAALPDPAGSCVGAHWRATPGNLATIRMLVARDKANGEGATQWTGLADDMAAAIASGRGFSPALRACAHGARPAAARMPARLPPSAMRGRLVVVTDRFCFSSCLIAVDGLRALGALQVGEGTDISTHYMEVREVRLPSGLRTFSVLQKVVVGIGDFGPYLPERPYPGPLDDSPALKAWVAALR